MKAVRIILLGCLAAVWIVACGQDTVDPLNNEGEGHPGAIVTALEKALGKGSLFTKAELATVTDLHVKGLYGESLDQYELDLLAACVNLVELNIRAMGLSNEQLAVLAGLTKLESLKLAGNNITDLSPIAGLTNLRTLDISSNPIADLRLRPVIGLPNLTALSAADIGMTDLRPLVGLVNLQHLGLWNNDIDDISPIAELVNLRHLDLSSNAIDNLTPLAGLIRLRHLRLISNAIDDLTPIVGLIHLVTLRLDNNKIVDIQPLIDNIGIGAGDEIRLRANKLSEVSRNQHIPALEARGVTVLW